MRRRLLWMALTVAALGLAACGVGGDGEDPPVPSPGTSTPGASSAASDSAPPPSSSSAQPAPSESSTPDVGGQLGQPVATRNGSDNGDKLTLQMYPIVRNGQVAQVNFTLSAPGPDGVSIQNLLSDGDSTVGDRSMWTVDGLQLVDGQNAKLYLVASDGQGLCLCSRSLAGVRSKNNVPVVLSATFAAPPAEVTTVDVRIPNFGTVKNVPVE